MLQTYVLHSNDVHYNFRLYLRMWYNMAATVCGAVSVNFTTSDVLKSGQSFIIRGWELVLEVLDKILIFGVIGVCVCVSVCVDARANGIVSAVLAVAGGSECEIVLRIL
jgi:hypothetical protein